VFYITLVDNAFVKFWGDYACGGAGCACSGIRYAINPRVEKGYVVRVWGGFPSFRKEAGDLTPRNGGRPENVPLIK